MANLNPTSTKDKKYKIKPSVRAKKAIKLALENGGNMSKAMREAGYSPALAKNPQKLTSSKAWRMMLDSIMPDEFVLEQHKKLFEQKQINYFVFPKSMEDKEIIEHVEASGLKVVNVRMSDKGKMAFYSIPDANAIKSALDMVHKLKGRYSQEEDPDKPINRLPIVGMVVILEKN